MTVDVGTINVVKYHLSMEIYLDLMARMSDGSMIGRKELVFDALRENPTLPLRSLAKNMNMSLSTIQEYVGALKAEGRLVREGGTRGKWRCVK